MSVRSITPDVSTVEIPIDAWSRPFWEATAAQQLLLPRCSGCGLFRWPAGPFCPRCHAQTVQWLDPGQGRIYSFTVLPTRRDGGDTQPLYRIPVLVEFDAAPGVRLVSSLIDADPALVEIGMPVEPHWLAAANATVPVFRLEGSFP
jgi:uncharacterized OB-fold protein